MKDFVWEKNNNKWEIKNVPIGEGMVDFDKYLSQYKEFALSGPISLHIEYPMFPGPEDQFNKDEKNKLASDILKKELSFIRNHLKSAGIASN